MGKLMWGAIAGAALMYFFDPEKGNRRQAWLRDKANKYMNKANDMFEGKSEDLSNRAYGMMHETKSALGMNDDKDNWDKRDNRDTSDRSTMSGSAMSGSTTTSTMPHGTTSSFGKTTGGSGETKPKAA